MFGVLRHEDASFESYVNEVLPIWSTLFNALESRCHTLSKKSDDTFPRTGWKNLSFRKMIFTTQERNSIMCGRVYSTFLFVVFEISKADFFQSRLILKLKIRCRKFHCKISEMHHSSFESISWVATCLIKYV